MMQAVENLARNAESGWPTVRFLHRLAHPASELRWVILDRSQTLPDWRINRRRIPEHLVYVAVAGEAAGEIDGRPIRLEPGALLWIDPGVPHSFSNVSSKAPLDLFHFRFRLRHGRREVHQGLAPRLVHGCLGLVPLCQMLRTEHLAPHAHGHEHQKALLSALLIQAGQIATDAPGGKLNQAQRRSLEILAARERYQLAPARLAGELRLNPDYFRRLFTVTYGMPPRRWLVRRRLETATVLLRESMLNVSEVAAQAGYPDVFQFSRRFKAEFGQSPSAYRKT
jgi:AraC-like DNA-binding protein